MSTKTIPAKSLYVSGAQLLDPTQKLKGEVDLLVENGRVAAVDKAGSLKAKAKGIKAVSVDGRGFFLAPGFVDLDCAIHEPGAEHIESFATGSSAAAAGGFTTLLIKPLTIPVHDNAFMTDFILRRARENSRVRIVTMGAMSAGREGKKLAEIGGMAAAGARAIGDAASVTDTYLMRKALEYARAFSVPIFSFPEDKSLAGQGVMSEGWNSNRLGLRGIPAAAEEIIVTRDIVLARHTNGRLHFQPISTLGSIRAIRHAKEQGLAITAETQPAYFTLTSDSIAGYDANYKCVPPLRSEEDREALIAALADGTLDLISSGHSPQTRAAKEQTFEFAAAGMISLETTFSLTLELVRKKQISPLRMVELLSTAPARVLGILGEAGSLKAGSVADFVLFDPKAMRDFTPGTIHSAARNSPFVGQKLPGVVRATYVGGTSVFEQKGKA
ncbi:MAG: dihydroorotase family protein [Bacteriovoracia bacterium]